MKKGTIKTIVAMACVTAVGVAPVFANAVINSSTSASASASTTTSVSTSYKFGDVNRDGKANLNDTKIILCAAIGVQKPEYKLDAEQVALADFVADGKIDLKDAKASLKDSLGIKN